MMAAFNYWEGDAGLTVYLKAIDTAAAQGWTIADRAMKDIEEMCDSPLFYDSFGEPGMMHLLSIDTRYQHERMLAILAGMDGCRDRVPLVRLWEFEKTRCLLSNALHLCMQVLAYVGWGRQVYAQQMTDPVIQLSPQFGEWVAPPKGTIELLNDHVVEQGREEDVWTDWSMLTNPQLDWQEMEGVDWEELND